MIGSEYKLVVDMAHNKKDSTGGIREKKSL